MVSSTQLTQQIAKLEQQQEKIQNSTDGIPDQRRRSLNAINKQLGTLRNQLSTVQQREKQAAINRKAIEAGRVTLPKNLRLGRSASEALRNPHIPVSDGGVAAETAFLKQQFLEGRIGVDQYLTKARSLGIKQQERERKAAAFRAARSSRRAQGIAAKAEEQRQLQLRELQRQNRSQQIVANQKQRDKVRADIEAEGFDPANLQQANLTRLAEERLVGKNSTAQEKRQSEFARQQALIPVSQRGGRTTSRQVNAVDLQRQSRDPTRITQSDLVPNVSARPEVSTPISDISQSSSIGLFQGPPDPRKSQSGFIVSPNNQRVGFIATVPPQSQRQPAPLSSPVEDFFRGISDPFINLGRTVAAIPEGFKRDIEARRIGAGDEFFQSEVAPELKPTPFSDVLQGRFPDVSTPRRQGAAVGEGLLLFAPTLLGRALSRTPKPIDNTKVLKNVKSEVVPETQQGQVVLRPTNPFRTRLPPNDELFAADTATPIASQRVPLGTGQGVFVSRQPLGAGAVQIIPRDGGLPGPTQFNNFRGGPSAPTRFVDPEIRPTDIVNPRTGLVQRTKTKKVTKQQDPIQKTVESSRISSAEDILFGPKRNLKTKVKGRKRIQDVLPVERIVRQKPTAKQKQKNRLRELLPTQAFVRQPALDLVPAVAVSPAFNVAEKPAAKSLTKTKQSTRQRQGISSFVPPILRQPQTTTPRQSAGLGRSPLFFRFPFFGGGGSGGGIGSPSKRTSKKFIVSNLDPLRGGVISARGVPEIQTSLGPNIFGKVDKQLKKARKKKGKKDDILGQFGGTIDI